MKNVVVIGAGIAGTAVADELVLRGFTNVTVIDRGPLFKTGGATSHAPGLVTRTSPSQMMFGLADATINKLMSMDVDGAPCFYPVGSVEVATTPERLAYLTRRLEFAQSWGFTGELLSPDECAQRNPLLDPATILGGYATRNEGIGKALRGAEAQGRRAMASGARFIGDAVVESIATAGGRVTGVIVGGDLIVADAIVLAAGAWGHRLAATAGVVLPMVAMEHQYAITEPLAGLASHRDADASIPFVRHWDGGVYVRNEGDRAGIGSFNHRALPVTPETMEHGSDRRIDPSIFAFTQVDWDEAWERTVEVMPSLSGKRLDVSYNGVFAYTPDGLPLLGEAPGVSGLWVVESLWATHSIGAARSVVQTMLGDEPDVDISPADIARFDGPELTAADYEVRCDNSYVDTYAIHHPAEGSASPRGVRRSPFYAAQESAGAAFFDASAWERPRWYESNATRVAGTRPRDAWSSMHWSPICAAEHMAVRESAGLFDMTSLRRVAVTGPDAGKLLSWLGSRDAPSAIGGVVYSLLLTPRGRIVSDVTIARVDEDSYLVGGNSPRDVEWLRRHANGLNVTVEDRTAQTACLAVWGPAAREALADLVADDISNEEFPYYSARHLEVAGTRTFATRVSYVGELGWELVCDTDVAPRLWERLANAVSRAAGVLAGRGALQSLRMEKGYRAWGTDMTRADTPAEAGLGFAVRAGSRLGLPAATDNGARRRLVTLRIDRDDVVPVFGNPVWLGDAAVGSVTSAEYGWTVGHPVAYAWLPTSLAHGDVVTVRSGGEVLPATVVTDAVFDPTGERLRA